MKINFLRAITLFLVFAVIGSFTVSAQVPGPISPLPYTYQITDLMVPVSAPIGQEVSGIVSIKTNAPSASELSVLVFLNGERVDRVPISFDQAEEQMISFEFTLVKRGISVVEVRVGLDSRRAKIEAIGTAVSVGDFSQFDADGNCRLDDSDFFYALDQWILGGLSDDRFFAAVDLWISQADLCAAAAGTRAIALRNSGSGLLISTQNGQALGPLSIYDADGQVVFASKATASKLHWNLRDLSGSPVANGVYFARFEQTGLLKSFIVVR